ncbi:MAG: hypothetical protein ACM31C_03895 [Acidobacteriota bacterium]
MKLSITLVAVLCLAGCKSQTTVDRLARLADLEQRMCACKAGDAECAKQVQKELKANADASGQQKLTDDEVKRAADINAQIAACAAKASGGSFAGSGGPAGSGSAERPADVKPGELPKECGDWKAMIDKLASCDKMPEAQRKVMKDAYLEASKTWEGLPPDGRTALAQACKAGAEAIESSAKATCGW